MSDGNPPFKERLLYTTPTDDRIRMRPVANNLTLHLHSTKVLRSALRFAHAWGLGGIHIILAYYSLPKSVLVSEKARTF